MSVEGKEVIYILNKISEKISTNKDFLSELDAAIGDGDHGANMTKGFKAVVEKLKSDNENDIGEILKKSGMALVSNVGGASGPLYGTAFMKAGVKLKGKSQINIKDFLEALVEALEGIKMRGKADIEDKTMIDALSPSIEALKTSLNEGKSDLDALEDMKNSAFKGVQHTKEILAKKGRASYLGERSLNHQDAGATSCALILETIYEEVKKLK